MATPKITERIARSLTLLRVFILASALLLGAAAVGLGFVLTHALRQQAIEDAQVSLTEYTNASERGGRARGRVVVGHRTPRKSSVEHRCEAGHPQRQGLGPDGVLGWTNLEPERIGKTFPTAEHLREVIQSRKAEAEIEELSPREHGRSALGFTAPSRCTRRSESGMDAGRRPGDLRRLVAIERRSDHKQARMWLATFAVFALSGASLVLLVRGARRARSDARPMSFASAPKASWPSYAKLEKSSLEAIESLNATVEAKDPYTAGHS